MESMSSLKKVLEHFMGRLRKSNDPFSAANLPKGLSWKHCTPNVRKTHDVLTVMIAAGSEDFFLDWEVPWGYVIEPHGHSLALYDKNSKKTIEAYVDSSGPVSLHTLTGQHPSKEARVGKEVVRFTAMGSHGSVSLTFRSGGFRLVERGIADPANRWRRWNEGLRPLTYLLEQPRSIEGRSRLLVVFSALGAEYDFTYNYRTGTGEVDSYRLFLIDDFGSRGSYYLADHRDDSIYRSVQDFIAYMLGKLGIKPANTTFAGSSKGGTAALIHGLSLRIGNIIVGAPQYRPGTYLMDSAPSILDFIAGSSGEESKLWLDSTVENLIGRGSSDTRVRILVGASDHHLRAHVLPLESRLRDSGTPFGTMILDKIDHQTIGRPFSAYLRSVVAPRKRLPAALLPYELSWDATDKRRALLQLWLPPGEVVSLRVFSGANVVSELSYSSCDSYAFELESAQSVRVRIYRRDATSNENIGAFTTEWLRRP